MESKLAEILLVVQPPETPDGAESIWNWRLRRRIITTGGVDPKELTDMIVGEEAIRDYFREKKKKLHEAKKMNQQDYAALIWGESNE